METKRLYLREERMEMLGEVLNLGIEAQLAFFGLQDIGRLEKELAKIQERFEKRITDRKKWYLVEKITNRVIGACGFHNWLPHHERAELGYSLYEGFHGMGFMSEALECVIAYGFHEMGLNRIEAFISPDNGPSKKLIWKLGFTLEGLLREHYRHEDKIYDSEVYSLLKSEYSCR
jgi:ribosomal-protein-alanine N-acetyltransferase